VLRIDRAFLDFSEEGKGIVSDVQRADNDDRRERLSAIAAVGSFSVAARSTTP
jgi:hypothetical protein